MTETAVNWTSVGMFLAVLSGTLVITWWAARRTRTASDFYAASRGITGFQNGLAITGDFISASTFLGISALIYAYGYDGLLYVIGALLGWPILLFLIAEPLRNLGKYSFADICSFRLGERPMRSYAACASLVAIMFYLIGQMVGAGKLIQVLFGLPYEYAIILIGVLMVLYVSFGGMIATTWVQIIKAVLLLIGGTLMALLIMAQFDFDFGKLFGAATEKSPLGEAIMKPGTLMTSPWQTLSLGLALCFGPLGLPHILMRFFTVPNAKEARKSVFWATGFIGYFFLLVFVIGFGATALIPHGDPTYFTADGNLIGGNNMSAVHVAHVVGDGALMGFVSAVAFATIVAVVSGLTLSAAATVAYDLYGHVFNRSNVTEKQILRVSRIVPFVVGALAIWFGLLFKDQNIAVIVIESLAIAGSSTFPVLLLAIYWKPLTTRGAFWGGMIGLVVAIALAVMGPKVWVDVLHYSDPLFPLDFPTLVAMPLTFVLCWLFSITDRAGQDAAHDAAYRRQTIRAETGIGSEGAAKH
ncbi:sodium:solute symporter family transporter [Govanella unica]|uniref:Sodium/solute symporter n=1 Tax=Govanella unica TaxID=2975056 RepID=A0A9X3TXK2_9PROT|nr:sodium/solute symporter [Govania unica]MDA5193835.1 sodium/solute symporter [Govania unica]